MNLMPNLIQFNKAFWTNFLIKLKALKYPRVLISEFNNKIQNFYYWHFMYAT